MDNPHRTDSRIQLWLDCDPGHDDAFAILLAAYHPALHLLGISTVYGNAPLDRTTKNALSILEAIGRPAIPVAPGAKQPFFREVEHAPKIHGESGIDGTTLLPEPTRSALSTNAIMEMYRALMACPPNSAWLVTTGTLTNAALLFAVFPETVDHIRGLSIMGGAVGSNFTGADLGKPVQGISGEKQARIGNHTPFAEFNIWCDPEAARSIFSNHNLSRKTTLIPLDVTHQVLATQTVQRMVLYGSPGKPGDPTRLRRLFYDLLMFFAQTYSDVFGMTEGPPLHDPLAVAVLLADISDGDMKIDFDDSGGERFKVDVELTGPELGRTKISPATEGVRIPRGLDVKRFWVVLLDCLDSAEDAAGYVNLSG